MASADETDGASIAEPTGPGSAADVTGTPASRSVPRAWTGGLDSVGENGRSTDCRLIAANGDV
jgi:hypothetical protein